MTFVALGAWMLLLSTVIPAVAGWAGLLVSLVLGPLGGWALRMAWLIARGRVVLSEEGVLFDIPRWNRGWLRKGIPVSIPWASVRGVTARWVEYTGTAVEEFTVETEQGNHILTRSICSHPERVAEVIERQLQNAPWSEVIAVESQARPRTSGRQLTKAQRWAIIILTGSAALAGVLIAHYQSTPTGSLLLGWLDRAGLVSSAVALVANLYYLGRLMMRRRPRSH